jgi:hypothetical protein
MTSGDDWLTASQPREEEETEADTSNSVRIPPLRLVITADSLTELSSMKQRLGRGEFIQVKEVQAVGRTAGGWRRVDKDELWGKRVRGFITVLILLWFVSMLVIFWIAAYMVLFNG